MKRGDVVIAAAGSGFGGKPRPAVIVQSDRFAETAAVTVCLFTTNEVDAALARLRVEPDAANGLTRVSWLMVDKVVTIRRDRVARVAGRLAGEDLLRLNRAIAVFLGLAG